RRVTHFLRDLRHTEHFLAVETREKKKLRERNVARREFLRQVQQEAALHFQNDVGKPFGIPTCFIRRNFCKRGNLSRVQGDKARNGHVTCQSCLLWQRQQSALFGRRGAGSLPRFRRDPRQSQI